jgi:hypothetical protein
MGVGGFGFLAGLTSVGVTVMVAGLALSARLGLGVSSVWYSLLAFHVVQLMGVMVHHLRLGPLARRAERRAKVRNADGARGEDGAGRVDGVALPPTVPAAGVECIQLPVLGEVCVTTAGPQAGPYEAAAPHL